MNKYNAVCLIHPQLKAHEELIGGIWTAPVWTMEVVIEEEDGMRRGPWERVPSSADLTRPRAAATSVYTVLSWHEALTQITATRHHTVYYTERLNDESILIVESTMSRYELLTRLDNLLLFVAATIWLINTFEYQGLVFELIPFDPDSSSELEQIQYQVFFRPRIFRRLIFSRPT